MERLLINNWKIKFEPFGTFETPLPASVYSVLLKEKKIPDPYYGLNESYVRDLCRNDSVFSTEFSITEEEFQKEHLLLCFDCIDTIASVYVNDILLGKAENMFHEHRFDLKKAVHPGKNSLRVEITSPIIYAEKAQDADHLWGMSPSMTMKGYQHIRKAHCMFGWDWGPQLPDMGIYRKVRLLAWDGVRLEDFLTTQEHNQDGSVTLHIEAEFACGNTAEGTVTVLTPDGKNLTSDLQEGEAYISIINPQLWWPNGYGKQPLYQVTVDAGNCGKKSKRIGLRTLWVSTAQDQWGSEFAFVVNGIKIFAMGADYIPEDNLIPRVTLEKTRKLIKSCVDANYNSLRVWGGGYYPDDELFDLCDENGLIVWQDFMFACAVYRLTDTFRENIS